MVRLFEIEEPLLEAIDIKDLKSVYAAYFYSEKNPIINRDGNAFVNGDCKLVKFVADGKLPIKFLGVAGDFSIPEFVGITSLEGCPKKVEGKFVCRSDTLTSLEYMPVIVGKEVAIRYLTELPLLRLLKYSDVIIIGNNTVDDIINKYNKNNGSRSDIIACQKELIDNGFEGNAQW